MAQVQRVLLQPQRGEAANYHSARCDVCGVVGVSKLDYDTGEGGERGELMVQCHVNKNMARWQITIYVTRR